MRNRAKKLLPFTAGAAALVCQLAIGSQPQIAGALPKPAPLAFEVASVKPHVFAPGRFAFGTAFRQSAIQISGNRVTAQGLLAALVLAAYNLRTFQLAGAPEWRDQTGRNQVYDIEARAPGDGVPPMDAVRQMLQTLLAERFQLKFHRETKDLPAYDLVVGSSPPKLKPGAPDAESNTGVLPAPAGLFRAKYTNVSISELVVRIGPQFDRPLFDRTGLQKGYDFTLEYAPAVTERPCPSRTRAIG